MMTSAFFSGEILSEPSGQGRWLIMCPYLLDMCPCKKSLKVQEKSFQAFVCVYLNAIELKEKRTKFRKLELPGTLIWPQCLSPMVFCMWIWSALTGVCQTWV